VSRPASSFKPLKRPDGLPARQWSRSVGAAVSAFAITLATFTLATPTLGSAAAPVAPAVGVGCTSAPFVSSAKAKTWYRIPAVVRTGSGALVAFVERRDNDSTSDRGNYDIVSRTSTNGGCSWGALHVVADEGRNHISSPVPIWDPGTQSVLLFSSLRNTKDVFLGHYLQRSYDDGATWGPLLAGKVTVTAAYPGQSKGGLQGPGHGLVLQNGPAKGRIIFALGYKTKAGIYGTYGFYSDDAGRTWRVGYDRVSPGAMQLIEGTIAELPDGRLRVSYRDKRKTRPGTNRVSAISTDAGASISAYSRMAGVKTMAVEGSLLQTSGNKAPLLFSAPSYVKTKNLTIRRDMRIFVSFNAGASWHPGPLIGGKKRPAAYSDLVEIDANTVGILYETGVKKWRERIVFVQVRRTALS
jgi:sialidase-1